jgi:hypothetical protein
MQQTKQATTRVKDVNTFIVADAPVCGVTQMDEKKKERKARNKRKIKTDRKNDESMRKTS